MDDEEFNKIHRPIPIPVDMWSIPAQLRDTPNWLAWRYELRVDKQGDEKWTKVPTNARTGRNAQSNNPKTWACFNLAFAAYRRPEIDGVGFVPRGLVVAVDLDHCRDRDSGVIEDWALAIVAKLDSYTEVSPSATGLRIFALGALPQGRRKVGNVEMYDHTSPKFLTVTGMHLAGTPQTIESRQAEIEAVHAEHLPGTISKRAKKTAGEAVAKVIDTPDLWDIPVETDAPEDDELIIEFARMSPNGGKFRALWAGRLDYHDDDPSRADLALCSMLAFWVGCDPCRIDRLYRDSGLYRDKWEREDYRRRTVGMAISTDKWFDWSSYWVLVKQEQIHAIVGEYTTEGM